MATPNNQGDQSGQLSPLSTTQKINNNPYRNLFCSLKNPWAKTTPGSWISNSGALNKKIKNCHVVYHVIVKNRRNIKKTDTIFMCGHIFKKKREQVALKRSGRPRNPSYVVTQCTLSPI